MYTDDFTVKKRRSNFKDNFMDWHRKIGYPAPIMDIDMMIVDKNKAVAICEIKSEHAKGINLKTNFGVLVLIDLANKSKLPAYIIRHNDLNTKFKIKPLNKFAIKKEKSAKVKYYNALEYIVWEYSLRNRKPPKKIIELFSWRKKL